MTTGAKTYAQVVDGVRRVKCGDCGEHTTKPCKCPNCEGTFCETCIQEGGYWCGRCDWEAMAKHDRGCDDCCDCFMFI